MVSKEGRGKGSVSLIREIEMCHYCRIVIGDEDALLIGRMRTRQGKQEVGSERGGRKRKGGKRVWRGK